MVREVRLYIEGGGSEEATKRPFREGLRHFFRDFDGEARQKRIPFELIPCGSQSATCRNFGRALADHPEAFNLLLIDAECPVSVDKTTHVRNNAGQSWAGVGEDHFHLMVQVMEAWFLADPEGLTSYYGQEFNANALPPSNDIEVVEKAKVLKALEQATAHTQKGKYHKIRHASELLKLIQPLKVRSASRHCNLLFLTLTRLVDEHD